MSKTVSKFGGSSMKDAKAMLRSAQIVYEQSPIITLVSATHGTTDKLLELIDAAQSSNWNHCEKVLFVLKEKHFDILSNLSQSAKTNSSLKEMFLNLETLLRGVFLLKECSPKAHDSIVSFGERLSSALFCEAVKMSVSKDIKVELFDSRPLLKTDSNFTKAQVNLNETRLACNSYFKLDQNIFYIGQGFIGSDKNQATTTLGRGGSDYSAALFAEAIEATTLEIWTDVAGIATTDPRLVNEAKIIKEISYDEASEMAQYGAKILHPTTLLPAMRKSIPVFVGSSYEKEKQGTWIKDKSETSPHIRAITKRSDQALLTIKTPKMLNAFGFMGKIFETFTKYQISVDCVTTSEISVAISTDISTIHNEAFIEELSQVGEISIEKGLSLISLIGNRMLEQAGLAHRVFSNIKNVNIRMLCLGASAYNFNLLLAEDDANNAIELLHKEFIQ